MSFDPTTLFSGDPDGSSEMVELITVSTRKDLETDTVLNWLGLAQSGRLRLYCGCRLDALDKPQLVVRRINGRLVCLRKRILEHAEKCVWGHIYGVHEKRDNDRVVGAELRISPHREPVVGSSAKHTEHQQFSAYISWQVSSVFTDAFLSQFRIFGKAAMPLAFYWFQRWTRHTELIGTQGEPSIVERAASRGVSLQVGLSFVQPFDTRVSFADSYVFCADWWNSVGLESRVYRLDREEYEEAITALFRRSVRIAPPYLCVATVEPSGRLRRLWLRPIHTDGDFMLLCDSQAERRYLQNALRDGEVVFKPTRTKDLDELADILPQRTTLANWAHLPDAICWTARLGEPVRIVEVRYSDSEPDPEYDARLERKMQYYRSLGDGYLAQVVTATSLPPLVQGPSQMSIPLSRGDVSEAALALLAERMNKIVGAIG